MRTVRKTLVFADGRRVVATAAFRTNRDEVPVALEGPKDLTDFLLRLNYGATVDPISFDGWLHRALAPMGCTATDEVSGEMENMTL